MIKNNIIINPGYGSSGYFNIPSAESSEFFVSNNLTTLNISQVKFTNPAINDYSLQTSSLAVNSGADLSAIGITDDYIGTIRPQGSAFDIGAYEFVFEQTPTPTTIPGDANGDGKVDGVDYLIWLNHYNQNSGNGVRDGDFNEDGTVNGVDYVIWLVSYNV